MPETFKAGDTIRMTKNCSQFKKGMIYPLIFDSSHIPYASTTEQWCPHQELWELVTPAEEQDEQAQNVVKLDVKDYPLGKPNVQKQQNIIKNQIYANIISWCYIMDGKFPDKNEWRTAFSEMLKKELLIS